MQKNLSTKERRESVCVCVCEYVSERESERESERDSCRLNAHFSVKRCSGLEMSQHRESIIV